MEEATFQGNIAALIDAAARVTASMGEYVRRFVTITAPGLAAPVLTNILVRVVVRLHIQETAKISLTTEPQNQKIRYFDSVKKPFSVYCDLQSEPGFVWASIQSLSFANKATYKDKGFGTDFPVNDNNNEPEWNSYRLSL